MTVRLTLCFPFLGRKHNARSVVFSQEGPCSGADAQRGLGVADTEHKAGRDGSTASAGYLCAPSGKQCSGLRLTGTSAGCTFPRPNHDGTDYCASPLPTDSDAQPSSGAPGPVSVGGASCVATVPHADVARSSPVPPPRRSLTEHKLSLGRNRCSPSNAIAPSVPLSGPIGGVSLAGAASEAYGRDQQHSMTAPVRESDGPHSNGAADLQPACAMPAERYAMSAGRNDPWDAQGPQPMRAFGVSEPGGVPEAVMLRNETFRLQLRQKLIADQARRQQRQEEQQQRQQQEQELWEDAEEQQKRRTGDVPFSEIEPACQQFSPALQLPFAQPHLRRSLRRSRPQDKIQAKQAPHLHAQVLGQDRPAAGASSPSLPSPPPPPPPPPPRPRPRPPLLAVQPPPQQEREDSDDEPDCALYDGDLDALAADRTAAWVAAAAATPIDVSPNVFSVREAGVPRHSAAAVAVGPQAVRFLDGGDRSSPHSAGYGMPPQPHGRAHPHYPTRLSAHVLPPQPQDPNSRGAASQPMWSHSGDAGFGGRGAVTGVAIAPHSSATGVGGAGGGHRGASASAGYERGLGVPEDASAVRYLERGMLLSAALKMSKGQQPPPPKRASAASSAAQQRLLLKQLSQRSSRNGANYV